MFLKSLDIHKDSPIIRNVINYIMEVPENKKTGMVFQKADDAEKSKSLLESHFDETLYENPSVHITLKYCLHWGKKEDHDVALFTNDNELFIDPNFIVSVVNHFVS